MKSGLPCLNSCSPFAIEPVDRIQMAIGSLSEPVDAIQIAGPIVIANEVAIITQLGTKNIIKGIRGPSPLCAGA